MKIKLDENLPRGLVSVLESLGHDVDTAADEGLTGADDPALATAARAASRFLVTQDLDFSDIRRPLATAHPGVLLIRLRHPSRRRLLTRVEALFRTEAVETWKGCLVVATELKVRIRRP